MPPQYTHALKRVPERGFSHPLTSGVHLQHSSFFFFVCQFWFPFMKIDFFYVNSSDSWATIDLLGDNAINQRRSRAPVLECVDKLDDRTCRYLTSIGFCSLRRSSMEVYCKKSCRICG